MGPLNPNTEYQTVKQKTKQVLKKYEIAKNDVTFAGRPSISRGGSGDVYRAELRAADGKPSSVVAVKVLKPLRNPENNRQEKHVLREMEVWARTAHGNILPPIGYYLSEDALEAWIISPLLSYGSIVEHIRVHATSSAYDLRERLQWALDTTCGLHYLHSLEKPIVHGDLKALNTLLSDSRRAVLGDFGLAKTVQHEPSGHTTSQTSDGTTPFLSPELAVSSKPGAPPKEKTFASDMWAWGCLIVQILEDMDPYQDVEDYDGRNTITEGVLPTLESSLKMASLWPLLQKCWKQKPEQRAKSTACLEHLKNLITEVCGLHLRATASPDHLPIAETVSAFPEQDAWSHELVEPQEGTSIYLEPRELAFDCDLNEDQVISTRIYNVHHVPLIYNVQEQPSSTGSRFHVSPACCILPPRTYIDAEVMKAKHVSLHSARPTEDRLRLLYSFVNESAVGQAPTKVWKERIARESVDFLAQELVARSMKLVPSSPIVGISQVAVQKTDVSLASLSLTSSSVLVSV